MLDLHDHEDQACQPRLQQVANVVHDKPQLTLFVVVSHALLIGQFDVFIKHSEKSIDTCI